MTQRTLNEIKELVMQQAKEKGWVVDKDKLNVPEKIALVHTEISEAFEAYRRKNMDGQHGFNEELADAIIRIMHLCGTLNIDIEQEILKKLKFNDGREWPWETMNEEHS